MAYSVADFSGLSDEALAKEIEAFGRMLRLHREAVKHYEVMIQCAELGLKLAGEEAERRGGNPW